MFVRLKHARLDLVHNLNEINLLACDLSSKQFAGDSESSGLVIDGSVRIVSIVTRAKFSTGIGSADSVVCNLQRGAGLHLLGRAGRAATFVSGCAAMLLAG